MYIIASISHHVLVILCIQSWKCTRVYAHTTHPPTHTYRHTHHTHTHTHTHTHHTHTYIHTHTYTHTHTWSIRTLLCLQSFHAGLDCEWVSRGKDNRPVALLQVATPHRDCYLIRLNKLPSIPDSLRKILSNERWWMRQRMKCGPVCCCRAMLWWIRPVACFSVLDSLLSSLIYVSVVMCNLFCLGC